MSLLVGHSEGIPRCLGNGQGPALGAHKLRAIATRPGRQDPNPGSYGFLIGLSTVKPPRTKARDLSRLSVVVVVTVVSWN